MKVHAKKKLYRSNLRKMAKDGLMNNASGQMVGRNQVPDNSMKRDFKPQRGK